MTPTDTDTDTASTICHGCQTPRATTRGLDGEPYCTDCLDRYAKHPAGRTRAHPTVRGA